MDNKRKLYITIIAVAAVVLIGLIILAICLKAGQNANGTETTGSQKETVSQTEENATGEAATNGTEETEDQPEDTTGETTEATESKSQDETKAEGSGNDENNGNGSEPNNDPDDEPDDEPDNTPDNTVKPTKPAPTEPTLPDVYPYNVTWKEYEQMSEEDQIAFYKQFKNHNEFKQWRTAAKAAYDETKVEIEIGPDGKIDLDQILKGQD